jgi:hypothetical protein
MEMEILTKHNIHVFVVFIDGKSLFVDIERVIGGNQ